MIVEESAKQLLCVWRWVCSPVATLLCWGAILVTYAPICTQPKHPAHSRVELSTDEMRMHFGTDYSGYTCINAFPAACGGPNLPCGRFSPCTVVGMSCGTNTYQVTYHAPQTCADPGAGKIDCEPAEPQYAICYDSVECTCVQMGVNKVCVSSNGSPKNTCTSSTINPGLNQCPYDLCTP